MLGRTDDAARYTELADLVRKKYNAKFLDPATGIYGPAGAKPSMERWWDGSRPEDVHELWWSGDRPCTQAGQALPLALGLVPDEVKPKAEAALLREVAAHKNRVSSGFVATPYLLQVLADLASELGYAMTSAQDYPSWYSMTAGSAGLSKMSPIDHDLMQEGWSGRPALMPSLGGNIAGWHMQSLGGIRPDPAGPGFKKIIVKPNVVGDLHWVESRYDSVHGRIVSGWSKRGKQLLFFVSIPANTTATVYVPAKDAAKVTESGRPARQAEGVRFVRMEKDRALYEITSGCYRFGSEL
jgi:alpha-L-rhamnosidase